MDGWQAYKFETYKDPMMIKGMSDNGPSVYFAISWLPCEHNRIGRYANADVDQCATEDLGVRVALCLRACEGLTTQQLMDIKDGDASVRLRDQSPAVSAWKPIETAPKDGSLILIREAGRRVQVARWTCPYGERFDWYVQLTTLGNNSYPTFDVIEWAPIPK